MQSEKLPPLILSPENSLSDDESSDEDQGEEIGPEDPYSVTSEGGGGGGQVEVEIEVTSPVEDAADPAQSEEDEGHAGHHHHHLLGDKHEATGGDEGHKAPAKPAIVFSANPFFAKAQASACPAAMICVAGKSALFRD